MLPVITFPYVHVPYAGSFGFNLPRDNVADFCLSGPFVHHKMFNRSRKTYWRFMRPWNRTMPCEEIDILNEGFLKNEQSEEAVPQDTMDSKKEH